MTPTITLSYETALRLQRAAEAVGAAPEELAERVLADFLAACDWSLTREKRELAACHIYDWQMEVLEATEEGEA